MNDSLTIRHMRISDLQAALSLKEQENWNQTKQEWRLFLDQNPEACLVACMDNQVVGTVTAITYGDHLAWIGMMLVAKAYRRKGISQALLTAVIQLLPKHISIKLDATPAGKHVYLKHGFVEEYDICRMTCVRVGPHMVSGSSLLKDSGLDPSPILQEDLVEIATIDEGHFGANRLPVLHFLCEQKQNLCWQIPQDKGLKGYILGRSGSRYEQIGPLIASSLAMAKVLISKALQNLKGQAVVVDVLAEKTELIQWLQSLGFVSQRTLTRMYLQSRISVGSLDEQYLICGPEFG